MVNIDELQRSIFLVVIETDNHERMKKADPISLESNNNGGVMPQPKYPADFNILIAYEPDSDELYMRARHQGGIEFLQWLERGRVFIKGLDGKEQAFRIPRQE